MVPMTESTPGKSELEQALELELSDEDILDALSHVSGYLDITTEDFRTVYHLAWRHALARLQALQATDSQDGQRE
jgi:CBS-domain-containing membrane protein